MWGEPAIDPVKFEGNAMNDFSAGRLAGEHQADLDREADRNALVAEARRGMAIAGAGRDLPPNQYRAWWTIFVERVRLVLAHAPRHVRRADTRRLHRGLARTSAASTSTTSSVGNRPTARSRRSRTG